MTVASASDRPVATPVAALPAGAGDNRTSGQEPGRPLLFVVIAYALSRAWVIPLAATGATVLSGRGWPTHFPALLGPLLAAALCATLAGRRTRRQLGAGMIRWRIGWRWWLVTLSPILALLAVLAEQAVTGVAVPRWSAFAAPAACPPAGASWVSPPRSC